MHAKIWVRDLGKGGGTVKSFLPVTFPLLLFLCLHFLNFADQSMSEPGTAQESSKHAVSVFCS